jgi:hypothetical protein
MPFRNWLRGVSISVLTASLAACAGADTVEQDKARFDQETNPVRKAKDFQKLSYDQMAQVGREVSREDYDAALQTLTNYRDESRNAFDGLRGTGVDAEKHSEGFRQLENSLRKAIWQMERTLPGIPDDHRAAFRSLVDDLVAMQTQLVHLLFPREPGAEKPKG